MLNDTIGRNTEPSNWYVSAINAPSDKYKLSDIQCNVDYFFQLWFGIRSLGVVVMLEGEVKLRLGHFLVYGSREKCVQYCCWWRIIIRNYLRPVHASSETTYEARVLYVEGVCVCVCLNSNVYRSFIKADSRRKQSLNTAIWPALARAGCLQTFSLWRAAAEAASHCGFWIAAIWLTSSQAPATLKTSWPWSLGQCNHHRNEWWQMTRSHLSWPRLGSARIRCLGHSAQTRIITKIPCTWHNNYDSFVDTSHEKLLIRIIKVINWTW